MRVGVARSAKVAGTVRSARVSRLLDRHVGRALLRIIGKVRRPRPLPDKPRQVAICVLGALGDTLLASALAEDIRQALPGVRIILVATATNVAMAPLLPTIDAVLLVPLSRPARAIGLLRSADFDLLIDCNQWLRISALYAALAGCSTVGFRTAGQGRHYAFDYAVDHLATRHEIENYRALLEPLSIETQAFPAVRIPKEACRAVASLLRVESPGAPRLGLVVFHPWAGGGNAQLKEWSIGNWIALAEGLQGRGYEVYVTGGPGDVANTDRLVAAAAAQCVTLRSLAGKLTLEQVGALLSRAQVVVTVNTGIMHLAATVDARLVALHGPTNPARWGPLSEHALVIVPEGVPSGYLHLGFEFPKRAVDCMSAIAVATVLEAVLRTLLLDSERTIVAA